MNCLRQQCTPAHFAHADACGRISSRAIGKADGAFVVPGTAPTTADVVCTVAPGIPLPCRIDHLVLEFLD